MRKFWLWCLLFLTACGIPARATPPSTPIVANIALTPSLLPYVGALHTCAATQTDLVLNISETPTSALDINKADLTFRFGGTPGNAYAAAISEESIVLIVNINNPVLTISTDKLHDLFTGQITSWTEVGGAQQSVRVWVYPNGEDIRSVFDAVLFPGDNLTALALLASDPQAMLDAVAEDPAAIGYVPHAWLVQTKDADRIRPLNINSKLAENLRQPVLALSRAKPERSLLQLLGCMQSAGR
jgi:hypothetical protein